MPGRVGSNKQFYEVSNLNLSDEMGITQREIDFINERTADILTKENVDELLSIFTQLQLKVQSLYDSEEMIQASGELLRNFYQNFEDTVKKSAEQNGKLIFNRIEEFLNKNYSDKTEKDIIRIAINILDKLCQDNKYFVNELEIVHQFQKYIISGILTNINSNYLRCISEEDLNKYINLAINDFISENEYSVNSRHIGGNAIEMAVDGYQDYSIEQLQQESYNIEQKFIDLSLDQVLKFCNKVFSIFSEKILEQIKITYGKQLGEIRVKLTQASKHVLNIENEHNKEHRKKLNESFLRNLSSAIYFRKTQQNLSEIIDQFENLNLLVNKIITEQIQFALEQFNEKHKSNQQPIFFSNLFDYMIDFIIRGFSHQIIPRSLDRLLDEKGNLEHIKKSIQEKYSEKFKLFQQKSQHSQNEELKKILKTNYFTAFDSQILRLTDKSKEWLFYFVTKMAQFDVINCLQIIQFLLNYIVYLQVQVERQSKFILMLHQISFGKLKEIKVFQQEQKIKVDKTKNSINQMWKEYQSQAVNMKMKGFDIQIIDRSSLVEQDHLQNGQVYLMFKDEGSEIECKLQFQNITIINHMKFNTGKKREFTEIVNFLIRNKNDFNIIFTLFFFYCYEKIRNQEIKMNEFTSQEFKIYLDETIEQAGVFNKFFDLAAVIKTYKLPYEIYQYQKRMNVDYEENIRIDVEDFDRRLDNFLQNKSANTKQLNYFQHYVNSNYQLAGFLQGCQYGRVFIAVQNFEFDNSQNAIHSLNFCNYYTQFLFTDMYSENYIQNKLEILFYHFCHLLKDIPQENYEILFTNQLISNFQSLIDEIKIQLEVNIAPNNNYSELIQKMQSIIPPVQQQQMMMVENNENGFNHQINGDNEGSIEPIQPLYHNFKNVSLQQGQAEDKVEGLLEKGQEEENIQELRLNQLKLQNEIQNEQSQLNEFKQKVSELENKLEQKDREYQQKLEQLQQINNNQNQEMSQYQTQIKNLVEAETSYLKQIEQTNNQQHLNQHAQGDHLIQTQNREYIETMENTYNQKIQAEKNRYEELYQKFTQNEQNSNDNQLELDRKQNIINSQKEELKRLTAEMNEIKKHQANLQKEINSKEDELNNKLLLLQQNQEKLNEIEQLNQQIQIKNNQLEAQLQQSVSIQEFNTLIQPLRLTIQQFQANHDRLLIHPVIQSSLNQVNGEEAEIEDNENMEDQSANIKLLFNDIKSLKNQMLKINRQTSHINEIVSKLSNNFYEQNNNNKMVQEYNQNDLKEYEEQILKKQQKLKDIELLIESKMEMLDQITQNNKNSISDIQNGVQNIVINDRQQVNNLEFDQLKLEKEQLASQYQQLFEKYSQLQNEKEELLQMIEQLKIQNAQLSQIQFEDQQLNERFRISTQLLNEKENQLENLKEEILYKNEQIEQLNIKIAELREELNRQAIYIQQPGQLQPKIQAPQEYFNDQYNIGDEDSERTKEYKIQENLTIKQIGQSNLIDQLKIHSSNQYQKVGQLTNIINQSQQTQEQLQNSIQEIQKEIAQIKNKQFYEGEESNMENEEVKENGQQEEQFNNQNQLQQFNLSQQQGIRTNFINNFNHFNEQTDYQNSQKMTSNQIQIDQKIEFNEEQESDSQNTQYSQQSPQHPNQLQQSQQQLHQQHNNQLENQFKSQNLQYSKSMVDTNQFNNSQHQTLLRSQSCNPNLESVDFCFKIFNEIYEKKEVMKQLISYIEMESQQKIKIYVNEYNWINDQVSTNSQVEGIFMIDTNYNAFVKIEKVGFFSMFFSPSHIVYYNESIKQEYLKNEYGQQIVKQFGQFKDQLKIQSQFKGYQIQQYFWKYLINDRRISLFKFIAHIGKLNLIPKIMIKTIEKNCQLEISGVMRSFKDLHEKNILVFITQTSFYLQFKYFSKNVNGEICNIYDTYIPTTFYQQKVIKEQIQRETKNNEFFKYNEKITKLTINADNQEKAKIFLITYLPLYLQDKQEINYQEISSIVENISQYNLLTSESFI